MKKSIFTLSILALSLLATSCNKDDDGGPDNTTNTPTVPDFADLTITFNHQFGDADFDLQTMYSDQAGNTVSFSKFKYLMSNLFLIDADGNRVALDTYGYNDEATERFTLSLKDVPTGQYEGLELMIGLDDAINSGNPNQYAADHPLSPILNGMHWDWTTGYIFMSIEGTYENSSQDMVPFLYHIAFDENKVPFTIENLGLDFTEDREILLDFKVDELFSNPADFVIEDEGDFSHSSNDDGIANKLATNAADAIVLNQIN